MLSLKNASMLVSKVINSHYGERKRIEDRHSKVTHLYISDGYRIDIHRTTKYR